MIIAATLTLLLLLGVTGGGEQALDFDALKPSIKENVADTKARKEILSLIDEAGKELKVHTKGFNKSAKEIAKINLKDDATQEEFLNIFEREDNHRAGMQEKLIDLRFKMRARMTPEEWKAVFSSQEHS
jgi:hypothetical protein